MSHLFERLASTMLGPSAAPSLRPLRGSIYAPLNAPYASETAPQLEPSLSDAAVPPQGATPVFSAIQPPRSSVHEESRIVSERSDEPQWNLDANRLRDFPQEGNSTRIETSRVDAKTGVQPLQGLEASPLITRNTGANIEDRAVSASSESPNQAPPEQRLFDDHAPDPSPLRAVQPSASAPIPARAHLLQPPRHPFATASLGRTGTIGRPASQEGESDEVHIHIGRIEVAAVTQPLAKPAPAPSPRKSLNLEEYLRRGNRRSG